MRKGWSIVAMTLVVLLGAGGVFAQTPDHKGPHFAFESTQYDFGTVDHRLPSVEYSFRFTNDGTEPLVITRTYTSCSCAKVRYDKKPVPPGGTGTITVIYEVSKKEAGVFCKLVEVFSNTPEKRSSLVIKGIAKE